MAQRRNEKPLKRVNPSGKTVWVARWTDDDGARHSAGTFAKQGPCKVNADDGQCCAQHALWHAYGASQAAHAASLTVEGYLEGRGHLEPWLDRHPRSKRTNDSYRQRVGYVLDVKLEGRPFREWLMSDMRKKHVTTLVGVLLTEQRRAAAGAQGVLRVLSAMWQDAIDDELAEMNPFLRVTVKANDPRIVKARRRVRVWTWPQMHEFARAAAAPVPGMVKGPDGVLRPRQPELSAWRAVYAEAMVRMLSDCGLRLGELLPLERAHLVLSGPCARCAELGLAPAGAHVHVVQTAHERVVLDGTKVDHGEADAGRVVPVPDGLAELLAGMPRRIDTRFLFPTPRGHLWGEGSFYRDVWRPARKVSGMNATPHEFRHGWVSAMRAAQIDVADLADASGHTVETATKHYTHALRRSWDAMRKAVGE